MLAKLIVQPVLYFRLPLANIHSVVADPTSNQSTSPIPRIQKTVDSLPQLACLAPVGEEFFSKMSNVLTSFECLNQIYSITEEALQQLNRPGDISRSRIGKDTDQPIRFNMRPSQEFGTIDKGDARCSKRKVVVKEHVKVAFTATQLHFY